MKIWRRNLFTDEMEYVEVEPFERAASSGRDPRKTYSTAYSTPQVSVAAGVHSGQAAEFNEMYKQHGITGAYHRQDGALVISDNNSRNEVMKVRGLFDREAGYRQWAGEAKD